MITLDKNLAENEIRPITLGRKNYLFFGNHEDSGTTARKVRYPINDDVGYNLSKL